MTFRSYFIPALDQLIKKLRRQNVPLLRAKIIIGTTQPVHFRNQLLKSR